MEFYHGTSDIFDIQELRPAIETGNLREEWRKKLTNKVFFTNSLLSAEVFAKKAAQKYGGNPVVYKVRPIGDVWHVNTNEYVADRAKILARYKGYEHKLFFRGEMSLILVYTDSQKIVSETYLSNYFLDDYSREFYIV